MNVNLYFISFSRFQTLCFAWLQTILKKPYIINGTKMVAHASASAPILLTPYAMYPKLIRYHSVKVAMAVPINFEAIFTASIKVLLVVVLVQIVVLCHLLFTSNDDFTIFAVKPQEKFCTGMGFGVPFSCTRR